MVSQRKPSIVFVHGLWADGSCFAKLIPTLQKEGFEVIASQHGLDSHAGDVTCVKTALGRVSQPAILVGHSYGGSVITAAGTDPRVAALVHIAAFTPDDDETTQRLQEKFPATDIFSHVELADGRVWLKTKRCSLRLQAICRSMSRISSGQHKGLLLRISSIKRLKEPPGNLSRAGTS